MTDPLQLLFLNFDYNSECYNEMEDKDENMQSSQRYSYPQKRFTAHGFYRDYPQTWKLMWKSIKQTVWKKVEMR